MSKNIEDTLKLALEALQAVQPECDDFHHKKKEMHDWSEICKPLERYNQAIAAIKEALAQPAVALEQRSANEHLEPVAWMHPDGRLWTFGRGFDKSTFTIPLYTSPPAQQEPFGYFQYDIRLDAWVQNRFNNKGVAFYIKEQK